MSCDCVVEFDRTNCTESLPLGMKDLLFLQILGQFMARAIADDILSPSFVSEFEHPSDLGRYVVIGKAWFFKQCSQGSQES